MSIQRRVGAFVAHLKDNIHKCRQAVAIRVGGAKITACLPYDAANVAEDIHAIATTSERAAA